MNVRQRTTLWAKPVTVEDCNISGASIAGIGCYESDLRLLRSTIYNNPQQGIIVQGGFALIQDSGFHTNGVGIMIHLSDNYVIDGNNKFSRVKIVGEAEIQGCTIFENALPGVIIGPSGTVSIRQCTISDGKGAGILVNDQGHATVEDSHIAGNTHAGIEMGNKAVCSAKRCQIINNGVGVHIKRKAEGIVEQCDLTGNTRGAWYIEGFDRMCRVTRSGNKE